MCYEALMSHENRLSVASHLIATCLVFAAFGCQEEEEPDPEPIEEPEPISHEIIDTYCLASAYCSPVGGELTSSCAAKALSRPGSGPRFSDEWIACVTDAADCDALAACSTPEFSDPCAEMGEGTTCDGEVLISCFGSQLEFTVDCAEWDLSCVDLAGEAQCQGDGRSCFAGSDSCEGTVATLCLGGREKSFDCAALVEGRTCELQDDRATCVTTDAECDPLTPDSCVAECDPESADCDESVVGNLLYCSASGLPVHLDCSTIPDMESCIEVVGGATCSDVTPE